MATIKKGSYRFNGEVTNFIFNGLLPFSCDGVNYNLFSRAYTDTDSLVSISYILANDDFTDVIHSVTVYRTSNNEYWIDEKYRYITVLEDTEVDEDSFNSFTSNTQMLIKAGDYRWNDVPEIPISTGDYFEINIPFNSNGNVFSTLISEFSSEISWLVIGYDNDAAYANKNASSDIGFEGWFEGYQFVTVTEDTYTPTTFANWFNANTKQVAEQTHAVEITYKGETISLNSGETVTLHTTEKKLTEDLVIKVNEASSGGSSECDGRIIEVDELPTENIDETALYKMGDSYHKYGAVFKDIIAVSDGNAGSIVEQYSAFGLVFELYYVKTRPTENIVLSGETATGALFACYYVQDENDILLYGDLEGTGTNEWTSLATMMGYANKGAITNISQATEEGGIYALAYEGWTNYIVPSGSIEIEENGNYDVSSKASANVNVTPKLQYKPAYQNGSVKPDSDYDGLSEVWVDVPQPSGNLPITENGTFDVAQYATVKVSIPKVVVGDESPNVVGSIFINLGGN